MLGTAIDSDGLDKQGVHTAARLFPPRPRRNREIQKPERGKLFLEIDETQWFGRVDLRITEDDPTLCPTRKEGSRSKVANPHRKSRRHRSSSHTRRTTELTGKSARFIREPHPPGALVLRRRGMIRRPGHFDSAEDLEFVIAVQLIDLEITGSFSGVAPTEIREPQSTPTRRVVYF